MTGATRRELTIQERNERLSRLEDKIANATLEIVAFRREAQIEFFATRELLEQKSKVGNGGCVLANQMTGRGPTAGEIEMHMPISDLGAACCHVKAWGESMITIGCARSEPVPMC
jgi:hypothetical protein